MLTMDRIDEELSVALDINNTKPTKTDFIFISKHASASGTPALTVC